MINQSFIGKLPAFLNKCLINHIILGNALKSLEIYFSNTSRLTICMINQWLNNLYKFKTSTLPWYSFIYSLVNIPKTLSSL